MTQSQSKWDRIVEPTPEQAYRGLVRSLRWSQGFSISFVECSPVAGEELIARLRQDVTTKRIKVLRFDEPIEKLFHPLLRMPELKEVDVLIVVGLEKSLRSDIDPKGIRGEGGYYSLETAPPLLEHLNWQRDNFREYFPHLHFVFLLPTYGIKYFIRRAPDFFDWRSSVTKYPAEREALERHLGELLRDTDFESYKRLSPEEIKQRIWEIEAQLGEDSLDRNRKAELCREQGLLLDAGEDYRGAIDCHSEAIRLQPDFAIAYFGRGNAKSALGDNEGAIADYSESIRLNPPDVHIDYFNRGNAKSELGDKAGAIADYSEAIRLNPNDAAAYLNRGGAKSALGDKAGAISDFREAARLYQQQGKTSDYEDAQNRIKELGG